MNRRRIIAGNWKMNLDANEARALFEALSHVEVTDNVEVIVSPPSIYLSEFSKLETKGVKLSSQNCSEKDNGAYTGEVSVSMLHSMGVEYVILGHSERRMLFSESDEVIKSKVVKALSGGLSPIFCCGELLEEREKNEQETVIANQLKVGLFDLTSEELTKVVIAYEPIWAIGTGKTATSKEAQEMHAFIRELIASRYGQDLANTIRILYGGSVKPSNSKELFSCPDVDGGLIGGASLKIADFISLIETK